MKRPNIVVCLCDQLRAFEVGCYGNRVIRTPAMDRLAADGIRFETAVTNFPVCMAARSVVLSGQHNRTCTGGVSNVSFPFEPGQYNMPEYPVAGRPHLKDPTLAEALRAAGYHTAAIGKWHIHSWPQDVGFDEYLIPRVHHCHTGQNYTENGMNEFVPAGYSVDFEADRIAAFLARRARSTQPFFLYCNISPPHCPLADAPERILRMYDPRDVPLRANVNPARPLDEQDYWFKVYRYDYRYYNLRLPYTEQLPPGYDLRRLIAEYYGLTTWADEALGRILSALDENGLARDTIVVFSSDHGDNLGSHGWVQKGGPNEESIRVPMLIRWPAALRAGQVRSAAVAGLVDIAPTLLDLAGLPVPPHMQGRHLTALLRTDTKDVGAGHAIVETGAGAGVRTASHLYFLPWQQGRKWMLADAPSHFFDLAADPFQMRNLAGTGEQAEQARALDALVRSWDASTPARPI